MPCGWEGNRRSGIALVMCHKLKWFIHLQAGGLRKGDEHPAYTPDGAWRTLPLPLILEHAQTCPRAIFSILFARGSSDAAFDFLAHSIATCSSSWRQCIAASTLSFTPRAREKVRLHFAGCTIGCTTGPTKRFQCSINMINK